MKNKVVLLDFGIFSHRAIFSYSASLQRSKGRENAFVPPPDYTCLSMMVSALKKVGLTYDDTVIIAVDSKYGSWRRDIDNNYKRNRKEKREKFEINWKKMFNKMDKLLLTLREATPYHIIRMKKMEADDIIAHATKYYKDKECIVVSYDSDFEQLLVRDNVKIFSPHPKVKTCPYKILDLNREKEINKAYKTLAKKVIKEASDNLTTEVSTEEDYNKRKMIVSLLSLPEAIEERLNQKFSTLCGKTYDIEMLPFPSIRKRFDEIYNGSKIITYEECRKKKERKLKRRKKK